MVRCHYHAVFVISRHHHAQVKQMEAEEEATELDKAGLHQEAQEKRAAAEVCRV